MRQKAFEHWEQAWLNAKELLEPDDPSLLATMNGLGVAASHLGRMETLYAQTICYLGLEQWTQAETTSREAIELFESSAPKDYRRYLTISMLGEALQRQGNVNEASQHLRDGYIGVKNLRDGVPPQAKPRAMQALDRLISMAEAEGDAQQVTNWQAERELWN